MVHLGSWNDYQVQADVKVADPYGEAGLIIRSSGEEEGVDAYHGYFAGFRLMDESVEFGRTYYGWLPLLKKEFPDHGDVQGWIHLRVVPWLVALGSRSPFPMATQHHQSPRTRTAFGPEDSG
jgi:hypothetical protein